LVTVHGGGMKVYPGAEEAPAGGPTLRHLTQRLLAALAQARACGPSLLGGKAGDWVGG